jgi:hypothetical protein
MKKLLIIILLIGCSFIGDAQEQDSITFRKNVVKFLPMNLPMQSVSFEYERMIDPNYSLTIGIGIPVQGMMMGKNGIDENLKMPAFSTMHIRAALRYYTGKNMLPKGFYIEPYLKYQQIKGNAIYEGVNDLNYTYNGNLDAKINTFNLGVQFGYQFLISKRVTIDLYFLGLEGGVANGRITSTSLSNPSDADYIEAEFKKTIDDLPFFIRNWLDVTKENDQVFVKAKNMQYPWYRGGFSVGIAF